MRLLPALILQGFLFISFVVFAQGPRYNAAGELLRPQNYRDWIWLTSGVGMTYGPAAANAGSMQMFDNVFVDPNSWRAFQKTGVWPEKTMFVLEIRYSRSEGSINKGGRFQTDVAAVEMAVKDSSRSSEDKWAYYDFATVGGVPSASAKPLPKTASCYACHTTNGAVENTFTQFYPTALDIAQSKGTVRPTFKPWSPSPSKLFHVVKKDWGEAKQVLEKAAAEEPDTLILDERVLNMVGYELLRSGDAKSAASVFRHNAERYPESINAYDSLSESLEVLGMKTDAVQASRRALELLSRDTKLAEARRTALEKRMKERLIRLEKK
jgi:tetratricopeptide (TPR) repeat protein